MCFSRAGRIRAKRSEDMPTLSGRTIALSFHRSRN
jgi:hypothetical protein